MGTLPPLGTSFFGSYTTLTKLHPEVLSAAVRYTESGFGFDFKDQYRDLSSDGRVSCGNPRCHRGGYDLRFQVEQMIEKKIEEEEVAVRCQGDEGTPGGKKKGQSCDKRMKGTILIKYKPLETATAPASPQADPEPPTQQ